MKKFIYLFFLVFSLNVYTNATEAKKLFNTHFNDFSENLEIAKVTKVFPMNIANIQVPKILMQLEKK